MAHGKIIYKDKEIFLFDYTGLRGQALLESLRAGMKVILDSGENDILCLADFTDTYFIPEVMTYLQGSEAKAAARQTHKTATVGVTGIKGIFLNAYNMITRAGAKSFPDRETAKEYLIS